MENQARLNPDRRSLPDGWVQHYDSNKQRWYYVQITEGPPSVTFVHPVDLMGGATVRSSISPTADYLNMPHPSMRSQGMTVAQKLYASSTNRANTAPMINTNNIANLSTSVDVASSPSPPPSSNRVSRMPSPTSISPLGSDRSVTQSRFGVQGPRRMETGNGLYPSNNRVDHNPHRAATAPVLSMNTTPQRPYSQSSGPMAPYTTMSGPRPGNRLLTKANPPMPDFNNRLSTVPQISPPSTSLLFSQSGDVSPSRYNRPMSSLSDSAAISPQRYSQFGLDPQSNGNVDGSNPDGLNPTTLLSMLKFALSMNPISESELLAVAHMQPNASYQKVLEALKQQQRYRLTNTMQVKPASGVGVRASQSSVDYQFLINEIGKIQMKVEQSQQAQVLQQQLDVFSKQQNSMLPQQQQLLALTQNTQEQALSIDQQSTMNQQMLEQAMQMQQPATLAQQQQQVPVSQQQALTDQQQQQVLLAQQQLQAALAQQQQQQAAFARQQQQQANLAQQQQQQAALAQQQATQEQALKEQALKLQFQQQQSALTQQQALLKQQADHEAALNIQQQQMLAQRQALMQATLMNQQLQTLQQQQAAQQSLTHQPVVAGKPQMQPHPSPNQHQQQQVGLGFGKIMSSVLGGQSGGQGTGATSSGATSGADGGNGGFMDSFSQSLNSFSGNSQDPSSGFSGLLGGSGNMDFSSIMPINMDISGLTSNVDFSSISSGMDFGSFGSDDC